MASSDIKKIELDGKGEYFLSDAQVEFIAGKINKLVNLPVMGEQIERVIFLKIVKWIDAALYKLLPNEILDLVQTTADGITKEEATALKGRLADVINKYLDLPFLSEGQERKVILFVIGLIVDAMVKGAKLLD